MGSQSVEDSASAPAGSIPYTSLSRCVRQQRLPRCLRPGLRQCLSHLQSRYGDDGTACRSSCPDDSAAADAAACSQPQSSCTVTGNPARQPHDFLTAVCTHSAVTPSGLSGQNPFGVRCTGFVADRNSAEKIQRLVRSAFAERREIRLLESSEQIASIRLVTDDQLNRTTKHNNAFGQSRYWKD